MTIEGLSEKAEQLLRQVHPVQFTVDGGPSSAAFRPNRSDEGLLSTRREHIGAERAYTEWVVSHESAGTWGITVGDVDDASLRAFDDSTEPGQPEGHASVDFTGLTNGAKVKSSRKLRERAVEGGCLHPPA